MQAIEKIKKQLAIKDNKDFTEVLHGSSWSLAGKLLAFFFGLFLNILISRLYGAASMGVFALVNSFLAFALIISLMGLDTAILRLIPECIHKGIRLTNLYWKALLIVVIVSILLTVVSYFNIDFIVNSFFNNENLSIFIVASLFIVVYAIGVLNENTLRALKSVKLFSAIQVARPMVALLSLLVLTEFSIDKYNPVYAIFYSYFAVMLVTFVGLWYVSRQFQFFKKSKLEERESKVLRYKEIMHISLPMLLTSGMYMLMSQTDVIMLGALTTMEDVGIYSIAMKISVLVSFLLGVVNSIVAPKFSELYHSNKMEGLESVSQKSSKLIFFGSLPIVIIIVVFSAPILEIFGAEFILGRLSLLLLVFGQFVNIMAGPVGFFLNMTGCQKELNYIVLAAGVLNIVLNYQLIPIYGIEGAAFSSMVSMLLWNVFAVFYIKNKFGFFIGYMPNNNRIR